MVKLNAMLVRDLFMIFTTISIHLLLRPLVSTFVVLFVTPYNSPMIFTSRMLIHIPLMLRWVSLIKVAWLLVVIPTSLIRRTKLVAHVTTFFVSGDFLNLAYGHHLHLLVHFIGLLIIDQVTLSHGLLLCLLNLTLISLCEAC